MINIAIFASGSGTNAENIARLFNGGTRARVTLVLTNRRTAGVIERMKPLNVPVIYVPNSDWDQDPQRIVAMLQQARIDLVVLAGFMHYVSPVIIDAFPGRILNIHPSLLPRHGGKGMYGHHVHEAVIRDGDTESGVTVHYVNGEMDGGEIIMQEVIPIEPGETPESLEAKVHPVEYSLYPRAILAVVDRLESETPPSVDEMWADALKIKMTTPPPVPQPPTPSQEVIEESEAPQVEVVDVQPAAAAAPAMEKRAPMPNSYLLWSVLVTIFCCTILGIIAIVFSCQVSSRYFAGNHEGAERASRNAQIWIIASFVLGVLSATVYVPMMLFAP